MRIKSVYISLLALPFLLFVFQNCGKGFSVSNPSQQAELASIDLNGGISNPVPITAPNPISSPSPTPTPTPLVLKNLWSAVNPSGAPANMNSNGYSAIWTGTRALFWGNPQVVGGLVRNVGSLYDPLGNNWVAVSEDPNQPVRRGFSMLWTGNRMLVWGGGDGTAGLNSGSIYDPATNSWKKMSLVGAPSARSNHSAVWTGTKMIIFGGSSSQGPLNNGGIYDLATDTWAPVPNDNTSPVGRFSHSAVWTGTRMIIWGGFTHEVNIPQNSAYYNTGASFNPENGTWTAINQTNAPAARYSHKLYWTGSKMIVIGGQLAGSVGSRLGAMYDPVLNSWTDINPNGAPSLYPTAHVLVWTGERLLSYSSPGFVMETPSSMVSFKSFNPATNTWSDLSQVNIPGARNRPVAVWADKMMILYGGDRFQSTGVFPITNNGGVYQ